ncbi:MAG: hypothetical protein M0R20_04700 [Candidatus Omnitrophica bacterium]|jgi:hypothetical protein|nr:hypothetical protein [Candidatus Omnitrophota bacterium]MDD4607485.1 hypothetical protein [Patescibacteria group bacterium]
MIDKSKITDCFNETGFPFQQWCLETIRNFSKDHGGWGYKAISEWPFTCPPSNGPLLGVHSTADIVAIRGVTGAADTLLFLVIECKRANANIKNWVFMSDKYDNKPLFIFSKVDDDLKEAAYTTRRLTFPGLNYTTENFDYCNNVIEAKNDFSSLNRNQEERVYKAIRQANQGIFALENKKPRYIENLTTGLPSDVFKYFVFLPVVVTTANLYTTDFDYKNVTEGNILKENINYTEKKWITYEFPLPDFINYGRQLDGIALEKRTTFIVNDKSFTDFLSGIGKICNLK